MKCILDLIIIIKLIFWKDFGSQNLLTTCYALKHEVKKQRKLSDLGEHKFSALSPGGAPKSSKPAAQHTTK